MKVLITGATGFVGAHLAEFLTQRGYETHCMVRAASNTQYLTSLPNIRLISADLADSASLDKAVAEVDYIVHCAGLIRARNNQDFYTVNTHGTKALLEAAKKHGSHLKRLVIVSSLAAAGPALNGHPLTEEITPAPVSHYGRSKLLAEKIAQEYVRDLPIVIVRPPVIYGPRDKATVGFFKMAKSGVLLLPVGGKMTVSVIHVQDIVRALYQAMTAPLVSSGSTYFVSDGSVASWRMRLSELAGQIRSRACLSISIPRALLKIVAETKISTVLTRDKLQELSQPHWVCSNTKAQRELAWTPEIDWITGTQQTYTWYKREGWL